MHLHSFLTTKAFILPTLFVSVVFSFVLFASQAHSQQSIEWISYPDEKGFAYIEYIQGGTPQELIEILATQGCTPHVLWDPVKRIGYHSEAVGVADFVNASFLNSTIEPQTKITLQCKDPHSVQQYTIDDIDEIKIRENPTNDDTVQQYSIIEGLTDTYIHWFSHPEINTDRNKQGDATIQYGGGSFYQLVSRLSIEGCNVHTLSIQNKHYSFQNTNQENKEFTDNYKEYIPQDTIIDISCVDNCDIVYGLDLVEDAETRRIVEDSEKCNIIDPSSVYGNVLSVESDCGDLWFDGVIEKIFTIMPLFQNICKTEIGVKNQYGGGFTFVPMTLYDKALFQYYIASVYVGTKGANKQLPSDTSLHIELHELCHVHQSWYTFKEYVNLTYIQEQYATMNVQYVWYETPMAQEFNEIIGFQQDNNGNWYIADPNNIFNREFSDYFTTNPEELSAQLCSIYIREAIQPNNEGSKYSKPPYITEEIKQWIEKYIVLPA